MYRPVSFVSGLVLVMSLFGASQATAADPEIEALKRQLLDLQQRVERLESGQVSTETAVDQDLQQRVEKLESDLASTDAAVVAVQPPKVVPGGWRKQANWRVLDKGMEKHRVEEILGPREGSRRVGKFEYWSYGNGLLRFYFGRLKSWEIPDGIEPD